MNESKMCNLIYYIGILLYIQNFIVEKFRNYKEYFYVREIDQ